MMKLFFLALLFLPALTFAQSDDAEALIDATRAAKVNNQEIHFDKERRTLTIGEFVIPVSADTHTRITHKNGAYAVEFMLQNNISISHSTDQTLKKAWHSLEFNSRKAAREFVAAFRKISGE